MVFLIVIGGRIGRLYSYECNEIDERFGGQNDFSFGELEKAWVEQLKKI